MIARLGIWVSRACAVWVALLVGTIVGGLVSAGAAPVPPQDGPISIVGALLIATTTCAAVLAGLAAQARIRGLRLALFLFATLFGVQTFMMQIETAYFNASVGMPWDTLARFIAASAISAAFAAGVAAVVFRPARGEAAPGHDGLVWRIPAVAATYVFAYFAAGAGIAGQSAQLRAYYYPGGEDLSLAAWFVMGVTDGPLIAFQLLRGALWALLALLIVRNLKGTLATRATMIALAFSMFTAPQLLFPNPYMPWAVRLPHLLEVGISNAIFGALAAVLLSPRSPRTHQPVGSVARVAATAGS